MGSGENNAAGWFADYSLADEVSAGDFIWNPHIIVDPTVVCAILDFDVSQKQDNFSNNTSPRKRSRVESCAAPVTKACREKMRRDRLNDRFAELCSILDPGKPPKADKVVILSDANRLLNKLRLEAQRLKESNEALQASIRNLKAEKIELRDEKLRLKTEKERIEHMLKGMIIGHPVIPHPAVAAASSQAATFAACNKSFYPNYSALGMWQWIPSVALDTSRDHMLRPPVA